MSSPLPVKMPRRSVPKWQGSGQLRQHAAAGECGDILEMGILDIAKLTGSAE
jgi:hypothetical protein